jgi:polysaccharide deacetylase family protein (PEP-CTERM system associated)
MTVQNLFTVDTEDWFQVFYANRVAPVSTWDTQSGRFEDLLMDTLNLLDEHGVTATFFVVGWLATKHPGLIRRIAERGHELAAHGHLHELVSSMTPEQFRGDATAAKHAIEDACGQVVNGYRAPGYSIPKTSRWALDVLAEVGYRYDSSLLWAGWRPFLLESGLWEIPPGAPKLLGGRLPVNGGFVFRVLPYWLYRPYVKALNTRDVSLNFYTHTWEIRSDYPRLPMPATKRLVQYANLDQVRPKVERLLMDFHFMSIRDALASGRWVG